jgi:Na+/H+ antiporter NhaD/arsenite permease-like protein
METLKLERNKRVKKLAIWTWTWVATMAIATFGPEFIWDHHPFLTPFAVIVNLANGILMILANRDLINHFDELEKKIHLEALALTLGLAVVVGLSYSLLDTTNLILQDAQISYLVMFIGITYLTSVFINTRRYK